MATNEPGSKGRVRVPKLGDPANLFSDFQYLKSTNPATLGIVYIDQINQGIDSREDRLWRLWDSTFGLLS